MRNQFLRCWLNSFPGQLKAHTRGRTKILADFPSEVRAAAANLHIFHLQGSTMNFIIKYIKFCSLVCQL